MTSLVLLASVLASQQPSTLSVLVSQDESLIEEWIQASKGRDKADRSEFARRHGLIELIVPIARRSHQSLTCYVSSEVYSPEAWGTRLEFFRGLADSKDVSDSKLSSAAVPERVARSLKGILASSGSPALSQLATDGGFEVAIGVGAHVAIETPNGRENVWIVSDSPAVNKIRVSEVDLENMQPRDDGEFDQAHWEVPISGTAWHLVYSDQTLTNEFRIFLSGEVFGRLHELVTEAMTAERRVWDRLMQNLLEDRQGWNLQAGQSGRPVTELSEDFVADLFRGVQSRDKTKLTEYDPGNITYRGISHYPVVEVKVSVNGTETLYRIPLRPWS